MTKTKPDELSSHLSQAAALIAGFGLLVGALALTIRYADVTNGYQGEQGIQGFQGFQGYQGLTGATGIQGVIGITGTVGPQGPIGNTGVQGIQGVQGATGPTSTVSGATGISENVILSYGNATTNTIFVPANNITLLTVLSNFTANGTFLLSTPVFNTKYQVSITFSPLSTTSGASLTAAFAFGTSSMPMITGTLFNHVPSYPIALNGSPVTIQGVFTSTTNTASYWFDVAAYTTISGGVNVTMPGSVVLSISYAQ